MSELEDIRQVVCRIGRLDQLDPDENMADAGFSSVNTLELLIELETAYDVSIPDERFIQAKSVNDLCVLIDSLREEAA